MIARNYSKFQNTFFLGIRIWIYFVTYLFIYYHDIPFYSRLILERSWSRGNNINFTIFIGHKTFEIISPVLQVTMFPCSWIKRLPFLIAANLYWSPPPPPPTSYLPYTYLSSLTLTILSPSFSSAYTTVIILYAMSNYVCYNELDVMYMTGVFNKVFRSFVR